MTLDLAPPPPRRPTRDWRSYAVVGFSAVLLAAAGVAVGRQTARPKAEPVAAVQPAEPARWTGTAVRREDFRAMLDGRTEEQVLVAVGRPDRVVADVTGSARWVYRERTFDPYTGARDPEVQVLVMDGKVWLVDFGRPPAGN